MYTVKDFDGNERTIKRLSQNEKQVLQLLASYEKLGRGHFPTLTKRQRYSIVDDSEIAAYYSGRRIPIRILQRDLKITHRASLSRTLKTLRGKELVYYSGCDLAGLGNSFSLGKYAKYISLSYEGQQVASVLNTPLL